MRPDRSPTARGRPPLARLLFVGPALLVALAGCSTSARQDVVSTVPDDYRVAHPITIDERLQTMDIPVGIDAGFSTTMRGSVAGFAQRFKASRSTAMTIVVPSGSPNAANAARISHQVHDVLVSAGVTPAALDFRSYRAGPKESGAPIRLAYSKIAASVEGCGAWPAQLGDVKSNRHYGNYGCATQSNLAAIVDNPLDLVYPREMTPADAGRRYTVLDSYRQGRNHATTQQVIGGEVSDAVP